MNQKSKTTRTNDSYYHYSGWLLASVGSSGGVIVHGRLLIRTLDCGGGGLGVCVGCIEVAGLTIYHPLIPSDGGVSVPQTTTGCRDNRSLAEQPVSGRSTLRSCPGNAPSPSWGDPSSPLGS
jgi:hypothetical protein